MHKRKSLSRKIRFEVFKRDKFKCQYCGKSAPNVILNVDHIDPVKNGGSNEIINLITSCFDCNQGKKARLLSDDTIIMKQRKQLELVQERREQLELMLDWKKSLKDFEIEKIELVSDYWSSLQPYELNENGKQKLKLLLNKFSTEDIIDSISIAIQKYMKFDNNGNFTSESIEIAFGKIGGICALKNKSEIDKKIAYVVGICRNRLQYWDYNMGNKILKNYITTLKNYNWTEEDILEDLENVIIPKTKITNKWTDWVSLIEKRLFDIEETIKRKPRKKYTKKYLEDYYGGYIEMILDEVISRIYVLIHIGKAFSDFNDEIFLAKFINDVNKIVSIDSVKEKDFSYLIKNNTSINEYKIDEDNQTTNRIVSLSIMETMASELIEDSLKMFTFLNFKEDTKKERLILRKVAIMKIEETLPNKV